MTVRHVTFSDGDENLRRLKTLSHDRPFAPSAQSRRGASQTYARRQPRDDRHRRRKRDVNHDVIVACLRHRRHGRRWRRRRHGRRIPCHQICLAVGGKHGACRTKRGNGRSRGAILRIQRLPVGKRGCVHRNHHGGVVLRIDACRRLRQRQVRHGCHDERRCIVAQQASHDPICRSNRHRARRVVVDDQPQHARVIGLHERRQRRARRQRRTRRRRRRRRTRRERRSRRQRRLGRRRWRLFKWWRG